MSHKNQIWSYIIGLLFILFGLLILLHNMGIVYFRNIWSTFWPILLILLGIMMIFKKVSIGHDHIKSQTEKSFIEDEEHPQSDETSTSETFDQSNIFGDIRFGGTHKDYPGGNISNVFGDILIDLSNIDFPDGERAVNVSGIFGSIKIKLPMGIACRFSGSTIAGSTKFFDEKKDGLLINLDSKTENYETAAKKLKVRTSLIFGDISVS